MTLVTYEDVVSMRKYQGTLLKHEWDNPLVNTPQDPLVRILTLICLCTSLKGNTMPYIGNA